LQHYNQTAIQNKTANEAAYLDWVEQHTAEQIRLANTARASLRRKLTNGKKARRSGHGFSPIKDDRQVKRPTNAFFKFNNERQSSGELKNIQIAEAAKLVKREWDAMSAGQRKVRFCILKGETLADNATFRNTKILPTPTSNAMPESSTQSTAIHLTWLA